MPVQLVVQDGPHTGVRPAELRRRAVAMLAAAGRAEAELSIVLVGDAAIQRLNRAYRAKDKPTDVLAFAQAEGPFGDLAGQLLGDVVVSVPTARRKAEARGRDVMSEVTMLVAHGMLHLLGWDHDTASKSRRMRRETARLCDLSLGPGGARRSAGTRRRTSSRRSGT